MGQNQSRAEEGVQEKYLEVSLFGITISAEITHSTFKCSVDLYTRRVYFN